MSNLDPIPQETKQCNGCNNCTSCSTSVPAAEAATTPTPAAPDAFRDLVLKIPANVPDEIVKASISAGQLAVDQVMRRCMVIFFPQVVKDAAGNARQGIGHCVVPVTNPSDIVRVLKLAEVTGKVNDAIQDAARNGKPGDSVMVAADGETIKENAARDLSAKAEGKVGGIIVPVS